MSFKTLLLKESASEYLKMGFSNDFTVYNFEF